MLFSSFKNIFSCLHSSPSIKTPHANHSNGPQSEIFIPPSFRTPNSNHSEELTPDLFVSPSFRTAHSSFSDEPEDKRFMLDELIEEILLKMPVKYLLQLKCVCKDWCDLIQDPSFIEKHLNHSKQCTNGLLLKGYSDLYVLNVGCDLIQKMSSFIDFNMLSTCNGLICLSDYSDMLYLWNPSTRRHMKLPQSGSACGEDPRTMGIGFYYNPSSEDYEVLRLLGRHGRQNFKSQVELYSLRNNSWIKIQDTPFTISFLDKGVLLFRGALHWVGDVITYYTPRRVIISFDIASKSFQEIQLPSYDQSDLQVYYWFNISLYNGRLCLLRDTKCGGEIWVMREYGNTETWFKVFTSKHFKYPVGVTKNGKFIFQENNRRRLCLYNPEDQSIRSLVKKESKENSEIFHPIGTNFVESLVPL